MRKVIVFNMISLDGFIANANGDMSWAHKPDDEWNDYINGNARGAAEFLFGRVTYQMMSSFWPTPMAMKEMPIVAEEMNSMPKVVFSKTLKQAAWNRTRLVSGDPVAEVRKLKQGEGPDLIIFGSGTIVDLLSQENLIDEYQLIVNPIILGKGKSMFAGLSKSIALKMTKTRAFQNGNVLISYQRV